MTDFVCEVVEWYRAACENLPEYQDTGYCILHYPSKGKEPDLRKALRKKLEQRNFTFIGAYFPAYVDFSSFHFMSCANFSFACFEDEANFSSATFHEMAAFSGTTFKGRANFAMTQFMGNALFSGATFGFDNEIEEAAREEVIKTEAAQFSGANFKDEAYFGGSTFFEGRANFIGTTFDKKADFIGVTFKKEVEFNRATFKDAVTFRGLSTFVRKRVVNLGNARIEKPELFSFDTVYLRPSWFVRIDARKLDFTNVEWYGLSGGLEGTVDDEIQALKSRDERSPHRLLEKTCRQLSINVEENRDYPTANEFHYWAMEALRKEGWNHLGLIATLYWALSGYGERPLRAFCVLVGIWLAFAAFYFLLADSSPFWVFSASDIWQGIDYARQAVVYSLSALARLNPKPQPEELGWFQTLVTVEGILGPLQIALFLLAVRRKVMR